MRSNDDIDCMVMGIALTDGYDMSSDFRFDAWHTVWDTDIQFHLNAFRQMPPIGGRSCIRFIGTLERIRVAWV